MKTARSIIAAVMAMSSAAFASDWNVVSPGADETVLVDRASIHREGPVVKAWVIHSYSQIKTIGDTAFPHKSKLMLYEFRCEDASLGFSQWSMQSGELGGGATVWAHHVNGVTFYQAANDDFSGKLVGAVCG